MCYNLFVGDIMFKELLERLKNKKQPVNETKVEVAKVEQPKVDSIFLSKHNNIYKMEITDYIPLGDYIDKAKSSDEYSVLDWVHRIVLYNNDKMKVNKGTYYIINDNDHLYNILFTDGKIIIYEGTRKEIDDIEKETINKNMSWTPSNYGEYITLDQTISFYPNDNNYNYGLYKHMYDGDTYVVRYYNKTNHGMGKLELTDNEAYEEIKSVITDLENIDNIETILDIDTLKTNILDDIKDKISNKSK